MRVSFISLGCAKNVVNCEQMMALCRDAGFELCANVGYGRNAYGDGEYGLYHNYNVEMVLDNVAIKDNETTNININIIKRITSVFFIIASPCKML